MGKTPKSKLIHLSPAKLRLLRIFEIDRRVRSGGHPNATELASVLEVHPRTVHRDIAFLREVLGAPIEYDPLRRGWRYTDPEFSLTDRDLPESEREALESARLYLAKLVASSLGEDIDALFEKIIAASERNATDSGATSEGPGLSEASPIDRSAHEEPVVEVSLLFRGAAASVVVGSTWNDDQRLEILSDGHVRLQMTVPMSHALERWVLSWADEVLIEAPPELAALVAGRQRRALRRQERMLRRSQSPQIDPSQERTQVPLDFERSAEQGPDVIEPRPARPTSSSEEPLQSDFGFKDRTTGRRRRKRT